MPVDITFFSHFSAVLPFIVRVDVNGAESSADNKNRGFSIDYNQIKCWTERSDQNENLYNLRM